MGVREGVQQKLWGGGGVEKNLGGKKIFRVEKNFLGAKNFFRGANEGKMGGEQKKVIKKNLEEWGKKS